MTKILCNAEHCEHNMDWTCLKPTIHIVEYLYEPNPMSGWYETKCRDFQERTKTKLCAEEEKQ